MIKMSIIQLRANKAPAQVFKGEGAGVDSALLFYKGIEELPMLNLFKVTGRLSFIH